MKTLKVGIIGAINSGKDTLANAIVGALQGCLNNALEGEPYTFAENCKFASTLHAACDIAGLTHTRETKETPVTAYLAEVCTAIHWVLKLLHENHVCNEWVKMQAYQKIVSKLIKHYSVADTHHCLWISPRQFMQLLGNGIRDYVGDHAWVELAAIDYKDVPIQIYSDCRFHNEAKGMDAVILVLGDRGISNPDIAESYAYKLAHGEIVLDNLVDTISNNHDTPLSDLYYDAMCLATAIYKVYVRK